MSDLRTRLERVAQHVAPDDEAFQRLTAYRHRRDRNRRIGTAALAFAVAAIGIGLVVSGFNAAPQERPAPSPGGAEEGGDGVVRRNTPEGEAAIQLVAEPDEISLGEVVDIRLVNRGEVRLLTGLGFSIERWNGERWVVVPWPRNFGFPAIGIILPPGGSTDPEQWPVEGMRIEPGLYRAVKSASYEDPEHGRPDVELEAHATFRVLAGHRAGPFGSAPASLVFPRHGMDGGPDADIQGTLTRRGNCLFLVVAGGKDYLIIWPSDIRPAAGPEGVIFLDEMDGVLAEVGDQVRLGGGVVPERVADSIVTEEIPAECRQRSYWAMTGFL